MKKNEFPKTGHESRTYYDRVVSGFLIFCKIVLIVLDFCPTLLPILLTNLDFNLFNFPSGLLLFLSFPFIASLIISCPPLKSLPPFNLSCSFLINSSSSLNPTPWLSRFLISCDLSSASISWCCPLQVSHVLGSPLGWTVDHTGDGVL